MKHPAFIALTLALAATSIMAQDEEDGPVLPAVYITNMTFQVLEAPDTSDLSPTNQPVEPPDTTSDSWPTNPPPEGVDTSDKPLTNDDVEYPEPPPTDMPAGSPVTSPEPAPDEAGE